MKPMLKWAGGKAKLLSQLLPLFPKNCTYYEPFLGGGALFFALSPLVARLSDSNQELMTTYRVVRDEPQRLIELLQTYTHDKAFFYELRSQNYRLLDPVSVAARMIYLNKTCYNGLYRVNRKGEFNAPFGNYTNPRFLDEPLIRQASKTLAQTELQAAPFDKINYQPGSYVYFDPPYYKDETSQFVSYTKNGFNSADHENLARLCEILDSQNVRWIVSNSAASWVYDRYAKYQITDTHSRRVINSKGSGRGMVKEVIIRNF